MHPCFLSVLLPAVFVPPFAHPAEGPVTSQYGDCVQDNLVTPQDGLVAPPFGDYVRTSLKNVRNLCKMVVFQYFFIRALELAANHEKQVFTFFAFLPPYMAVSGSPVPRKR